VGNCIGLHNYAYFVGFLASCSLFASYVTAFCVIDLVMLSRSAWRAAREAAPTAAAVALGRSEAGHGAQAFDAFLSAVSVNPAALLVGLYTLVAAVLLGLLLAYHVYLITINQTTNENVRASGSASPARRRTRHLCCHRQAVTRQPASPAGRCESRAFPPSPSPRLSHPPASSPPRAHLERALPRAPGPSALTPLLSPRLRPVPSRR
jgi:hypothetical protein